jgi:hypothetical protein
MRIPDDPIEYETECLEAVRRSLRDNPRSKLFYIDIRLDGTGKERRIVVEYTHHGRQRTAVWRLYHDTFGGTLGPDDLPEGADGVATGIYIDIIEG